MAAIAMRAQPAAALVGADLPGPAGRLPGGTPRPKRWPTTPRRWGRLGLPAADAYRIGQLSRIYWLQGRLPELGEDIAGAVLRFPGLVTLRCMRALASAAAGRRAEAAAPIEALADGSFAVLPRDSLYLASLAILAEAAVACRHPDAARKILAELTPYADRNLIQGVPVGWGAGRLVHRAPAVAARAARRSRQVGRHGAAAAPPVGSRQGWVIRWPACAGTPRPPRPLR